MYFPSKIVLLSVYILIYINSGKSYVKTNKGAQMNSLAAVRAG